MTSAAKGQKDKPLNSSPRLVPRPTAASAARAARNATNRNLTSTSFVRQSPTRTPTSPKMQRNADLHSASYKGESKADIKVSSIPAGEPEIEKPLEKKTLLEEPSTFNVEDHSTILKEETSAERDPESDFNASGTIAIDLINSEGDHQQQQQQHEQHENSDEGDLLENTDHVSRPLTPGSNKDLDSLRSLTPKSRQSSRPVTPRAASRPTTPAHPRNTTPNTTPRLTPQRVHTPSLPREGRPKTPSMPSIPPSTRVMTPNTTSSVVSQPLNEEDVRVAYVEKQRQFHHLKKELDLKQQTILAEFDKLRALQERMSREGVNDCGEGLPLQELVVFNVADWTAEEIAQLCKDAAAASDSDVAVEYIANVPPIDEVALADLDSIVLNVPAQFADLCLQAFNTRQEFIGWVKEYLENNENGGGECLEQIDRYNTQGQDLCVSLRELKSRSQNAVGTMSKFAKRALQERSALLSAGETLVREMARLRIDLETHSNDIKELQDALQDTDHHKVLVEIRRELEGERAARNTAYNKLTTAESQLRQSRLRISKMDRQLREAEASIASLTGTVKTLEDQSRQKEVQLEARARKLKESLKAGEVTSSHIAQHRDTLQAELQDLKQQIETLNAQHKTQVQELSNQLKKANNHFEEQTMFNQKLSEQKEATEAALIETQSNFEALTAKVEDLERCRPNPNLPTEREMDLWAELQSIKDILRTTEDEVTACKRDKVRFLETMTKITESDNKIGLQQKLAAELLSKEEIISKMQLQIRELSKGIKLNEQKVVQYEQYVRDLQAHTQAVITCDDPSTNTNVLGYEEEIMNLKMGLLEAEHRNDELSEKLAHKEQQIEQQDKTSRAQARVIKVREELINMLKNKETEQSRELSALQQDLEHRMKIVDEVNKQIAAKADEIQELFATLENKQQQIHRLEKIVQALEQQQRRAQAQRTRHEEKIAALEHELAANGRRERKFVFF